MFTHLHVRSWFSFLAGGSSPDDYINRAHAMGVKALALTDLNGVYGIVRFQQVCRKAGIKPIFGAEVVVRGTTPAIRSAHQRSATKAAQQRSATRATQHKSSKAEVDEAPIVLLAATPEGYANLCRILTEAHLRDRERPHALLDDLADYHEDLFCLTGAHGSRLWSLLDQGRMDEARRWVLQLKDLFGERLSIEVAHHLLPGDNRRLQRLRRLSEETGVPPAATGDVRYAVPDHYRRYDLMTCIRNGVTIFDPHPERPRNAEAYLRDEATLRKLIPWPEAFERTEAIAEACNVDLLPGFITPPAARVTTGESCAEHLTRLCREALERKYEPEERSRAAKQLELELETILNLQLEEFFLVVHEIVGEARSRGIRCAGRGSAANSIVAYLLSITGVDPLKHKLLFERFLHGGRKGTPDIDVDFDSDRREEVIKWMEERFGIEQTAMTATLVTYRMRSAVRDAAKALGWSMEQVDALSKSVPPMRAAHVREFRVQMQQAVRASPLLDVLIGMVESLAECPRHLGQHSGGMVLSRKPLYNFTPIQVSANGVKVVQFDKHDVEALGLVKFDVLGLRMMATLSEAIELIHRHEDPDFNLDRIPFDDTQTFNMIRAGETLGTFQIESQGQLHLLAQHQPETFDDIIIEIALFRPGPLQGGMVHPFVRRARGEEKVTYDHPDLEPVLEDTYGIILFQEQVLEVAHKFAGMSLAEADDFRALMSRFRDPGEMEQMRERFVQGATGRGVDERSANVVFDRVSSFVGYGFCRSHAAAFAKTVYESAYLKKHYPAAFMAAIMQNRPGMYNLMTLQEEALRFGVTTLPPDINRSSIRYDLEAVSATGGAGEIAGAGVDADKRNRADGDKRNSADGDKRNRADADKHKRADADGSEAPWVRGKEAGAEARRCNGRGRFVVRKPLTSVKQVSEEDARAILWERLRGPFRSIEDLYRRVALDEDVLRSLARAGAFDELAGDGRRALWEVGLLLRSAVPRGRRVEKELFDVSAFDEDDIPALPELTQRDRLTWDYEMHESARRHPMTLVRRTLNELEIRTIETCYMFGRYVPVRRVARRKQKSDADRKHGAGGWASSRARSSHPLVTVAGIAVLRQRPPTAKGVVFITLEDETGFIQCVVRPDVLEFLDHVFRQSALIVQGELHIHGNWRGLVVTNAWPLNNIFGGYEGHPMMGGGTDTHVTSPKKSAAAADQS